MSKHVCVLAPWEVEELLEERHVPNCSKHKHVKVSDAREMTCTVRSGRYHWPIAEWVGKGRRYIRMLTEHVLVCRKTASGHAVLNLVEKRDMPSGKGAKLWNVL
jgi:hypothetical protein